MKSVLWQNGQRVIKQILDWFSTAKDDNDRERRQDYTQAGVMLNVLNELDIITGTNNTPSTPSVTIRTGVSYDNNGERIIIDDETLSYDPTNPSDTTNDGLGNFISTPHSTGSKNIPLTVNSFNYLWIDYLQITDETVFTLQKSTNGKQFYKKTNGYIITVTTVNTSPTAVSIFLGSVNLTGFGVVSGTTISKTGRTTSLVKEHRVKIKTPLVNLSDATTSYGNNQELTLDDHIKAVGTGTISPQNPHGTSLVDIGVDVASLVAVHQKFLHSNGIIGDKTSITSSLYLEFHPISPGDDFVVIKKLTTNEVANVDGATVSSSDIPSDVTFLFSSSGDLSGTYYIYLDKFTKSLVRTTTNPSGDSTKLPLWSMVWTQGVAALFDGNLTAITDLRIFGTINNSKINNKDTYDFFKVRLEDGSASSPALTWQNATGTGFYRSGNDLLVTTGGVVKWAFDTSDGFMRSQTTDGIQAGFGTVSLPSYSFAGDEDTGMYHFSANNLGFATNGIVGMVLDSSQHLNLTLGSAAAPAYTFSADGDTGIYGDGSNTIRFTTGGVQQLKIDTVSLQVIQSGFQIQSDFGTALAPGYTFAGDADTGIYHVGSNDFAFSTGGVSQWEINSSGSLFYVPVTNTGRFGIPDGLVGSPGLQFSQNSNTGMYRPSANVVGFSSNGSQSCTIGSYVSGTISGFATVDGSASTPSFAFSSSLTTGIFQSGSGNFGFTSSGTERWTMYPTVLAGNATSSSIQLSNGTASIPSYSWGTNPNTGMYRSNTNEISWSTNGVQHLILTTAVLKSGGDNTLDLGASNNAFSNVYGYQFHAINGTSSNFLSGNGSASTPAYSFTGDTSTGIYWVSTHDLRVSNNGTNTAIFNGSGFFPAADATFTLGSNTLGWNNIFADSGSVSSPAYTFSGDSNTGLYRIGADDIALATTGIKVLEVDSSQHVLIPLLSPHTVVGELINYPVSIGSSSGSNGTTYKVMNMFGGTHAVSGFINQSTTSVSTSPVAILSGLLEGLVQVTGSNGTDAFTDLLFATSGTAGAAIIHQSTISGIPASRTYSTSGGDLRLTMGSGSYTVGSAQFFTSLA